MESMYQPSSKILFLVKNKILFLAWLLCYCNNVTQMGMISFSFPILFMMLL